MKKIKYVTLEQINRANAILVYEKLSSLKEYLPFKNQIYITYLPNEEASKVIQTSKKINAHVFYE